MTDPKVSVAIATHNRACDLPQALDSVLAQDLEPGAYEVIVVDDGSTDETRKVLSRYRRQVRIVTQAHRGLASACNHALTTARGGYFARLDADDTVHPTWLRRALAVLDRHPEACCVYPDYLHLLADGTRQAVRLQEDNLYNLLACGTMFRTNALRTVGGFRSFFWEEYDLYLRLRTHGDFLHLPEVLYVYRKHPASMTAQAEARRAGWRELIRTWGKERLCAVGSCPELDDVLAEIQAP